MALIKFETIPFNLKFHFPTEALAAHLVLQMPNERS
jgi:hypothetical protein